MLAHAFWLNAILFSLAYMLCLHNVLQAPVKAKLFRYGAFFCFVLVGTLLLKPSLLYHCLFGLGLMVATTALFRQRLFIGCYLSVLTYVILSYANLAAHIIAFAYNDASTPLRILTYPESVDQSLLLVFISVLLALVYRKWTRYFRSRYQEMKTRSNALAGINGGVLFCLLVFSNIYYRFLAVYAGEMYRIPRLALFLVIGYVGMTCVTFVMLFLINLSIVSHKHLHEVRELSVHDVQTGVLNRQAGLDRLSGLIRESRIKDKPLSICFVDINNLKQVNDKLGHAIGDNLIEMVSTTIRNSLRERDFVCRLGGDEFLVVFYGCNTIQAKNAWIRIHSMLIQLNEDPTVNFPISVSYGFAEYNHVENLNVKDFIERADAEMYLHKSKYKKIKKSNTIGTIESKIEEVIE